MRKISAFFATTIISLSIFSISFAAYPSTPISPSDNVLDPIASFGAGCTPTSVNCYIDISGSSISATGTTIVNILNSTTTNTQNLFASTTNASSSITTNATTTNSTSTNLFASLLQSLNTYIQNSFSLGTTSSSTSVTTIQATSSLPNVFNVFNASGTSVLSISNQGGLTIASATPATTVDTLYNLGGIIYWNGSAIGGNSLITNSTTSIGGAVTNLYSSSTNITSISTTTLSAPVTNIFSSTTNLTASTTNITSSATTTITSATTTINSSSTNINSSTTNITSSGTTTLLSQILQMLASTTNLVSNITNLLASTTNITSSGTTTLTSETTNLISTTTNIFSTGTTTLSSNTLYLNASSTTITGTTSIANLVLGTLNGPLSATNGIVSALATGSIVISAGAANVATSGAGYVLGGNLNFTIGTGNFTAPSNPEFTITGGTNSVLGAGVQLTIPDANSSTRGLVTIGAQNFAGTKTFVDGFNSSATASLSAVLNMNSNLITNLASPISGTDAVNKSYVDAAVVAGVATTSVISLGTTTAPGAPTSGDRYLLQAGNSGYGACTTNNIAQWNGASWFCNSAATGTAVLVNNTGYTYQFNGSVWVQTSGAISVAQLTGKQGGDGSNYFFLGQTDYTNLTDGSAQLAQLKTTGTPNFTGLNVSGTTTFNGISYNWPATQASNTVLSTNGSGVLSWITALTANLATGNIFVGNGAGQASAVAMSGDATINSTGALTLANTGVTAGTYGSSTSVGFPVITVDSKGRITSAATSNVLYLITSSVQNSYASTTYATTTYTDTLSFVNATGSSLGIGGLVVATSSSLNGTTTFGGNLNVSGNKIISVAAPTNNTDAANKAYVDALIQGLSWQQPAINFAITATSSSSTGDRYIINTTSNIGMSPCDIYDLCQNIGVGQWSAYSVATGTATGTAIYVQQLGTSYTWNGGAWASLGASFQHNSLLGIQGGNATEAFHLTMQEWTDLTSSGAQLAQLKATGTPTFGSITNTGTSTFIGLSQFGNASTSFISATSGFALATGTISSSTILFANIQNLWTNLLSVLNFNFINATGTNIQLANASTTNLVATGTLSVSGTSTLSTTSATQLSLSDALILASSTNISTTSFALYNNNGTLYWNGASIATGTSVTSSGSVGEIQLSNGLGGFTSTSTFVYSTSTNILTLGPSLSTIRIFSTSTPASGSATNRSLYIGQIAGNSSTTNSGSNNTGVGYSTLVANTTGNKNSAFGALSLAGVTDGIENSAMGYLAGSGITIGSYNSAFGSNALNTNTSGNYNTAVGYAALKFNNSATGSSALGFGAGFGSLGNYANTGSVYVGAYSGYGASNNSNFNTLIGYQAGYNVTTGSNNIILGSATSSNNVNNLTTGNQNVLIGNNIGLASSTANGQLNIANAIFGTGLTSIGNAVTTGGIAIGTSTNIYGGNLTTGLTLNNALVLASSTAISTTTLALYNNNGTLFWNGTALATGGGGTSFNALSSATGTGSLDNTNYAQTWNWSTLSTQTGLGIVAPAMTAGGKAFSVDISGGGARGGNALYLLAGSNSSYSGDFLKTDTFVTASGFTGNILNLNWAGNFSSNTGTGINVNIPGSSNLMQGLLVTNGATGNVTNGLIRFNFSGANVGNGFQIDSGTQSGNALVLNANSLVGGKALDINLGSNIATGTGFELTANSIFLNSTTSAFFNVVNSAAASGTGIFARFQPNSTTGSGLTILNSGAAAFGTSTNIYGGGLTAGLTLNNALVLASSTAISTTTLALYNNNGTLYWNGSAVGGSSGLPASTTSLYVGANGQVGIGTSTFATTTDALTVVGSISNLAATGTLRTVGSFASAINIEGDSIVVGDNLYLADVGSNVLRIFDISNKSAITQLSSTSTVGSAPDIAIGGKYLYATNETVTNSVLKVYDISNPLSIILVATSSMGTPQNLGQLRVNGKYLYMNSNAGLVVADISNPLAPRLVNTIAGITNINKILINGRYLYAARNATAAVSIYDLANPELPVLVGSYSTVTAFDDIAINGKYLYGSNFIGTTLTILDISNPTSPTLVNTMSSLTNAYKMVVSGRYVYLSTHGNRLTVIDVGVPASPKIVDQKTFADIGSLSSIVLYGNSVILPDTALKIVDFSGAEFSSVIAHALETGSLVAEGDISANRNLTVGSALTVGLGGISTMGAFAAMATNTTSYFGGGLTIASTTPASTTFALYNNAGTLYWNGLALSTGSNALTLNTNGTISNSSTTAVLTFASQTNPATTTNALYNNAGQLIWNGNALNYLNFSSSNSLPGTYPSSGVASTYTSGLTGVTDIAFDKAGNMYAVGHAPSVYKITPSGATSTFATIPGTQSDSLTFDTQGNLYIADSLTGAVSKITPAGVVSTFATVPGSGMSNAVFDQSGNLYTSNYSLGTISKITPAGSVSTFATVATNPINLAFDSQGNLFVLNYGSASVSKITPAGVVTLNYATVGANPTVLAFDSAGNLYVAGINSTTVTKINPAGVASTFVSLTGGTRPYGLAIDPTNSLYVSDWNGTAIYKVTATGTISTYATVGNGPQQLVFDPSGNLYTANSISNTISKISGIVNPTANTLIAGLTTFSGNTITTGATTLQNSLILASSSALTTTQNAIYNNNGTLYWNGNAISNNSITQNIATGIMLIGTSSVSIATTTSSAIINNGLSVVYNGNNANSFSGSGQFASMKLMGSSTVGTNSNTKMAVQGKFAYVVSSLGDSYSTYDITNPYKPALINTLVDSTNMPFAYSPAPFGKYVLVNSSSTLNVIDPNINGTPKILNTYSTTTMDFTFTKVKGNIAISCGYGGVTTMDLTNPRNIQPLGTIRNAALMSNCYGFDIQGNYAYYMSANTNTLSVVDFTNPANLSIAGSLASTTAFGNSQVKVSGKYAYVTSSTSNSFYVFDIANPANITLVSKFTDATNIVGNSEMAMYGKYIVINGTNQYKIIDVSDPLVPQIVGGIGIAVLPGFGTNGPIAVQGRYLYSVNSSSPFNMVVLDIGGIDTPTVQTGSLSAGILDVSGLSLFADVVTQGALAVGGSGLFNGSLSLAGIATSTSNGVGTTTLNAALYIASSTPASSTNALYQQGGTLYWNGSALSGGSSLPASTTSLYVNAKGQVGIGTSTFATSTDALTVFGNISNVIGANTVLRTAASVSVSNSSVRSVISGNYLYSANGNGAAALSIADISNPLLPVEVSSLNLTALATDIKVAGKFAFITASSTNAFMVVDVSNPSVPVQVKSLTISGANGVSLSGRYAYVAGGGGLSVVDIGSPVNAFVLTSLNNAPLNKVEVAGNYAYAISTNQSFMYVYNISNPTAPTLTTSTGVVALPQFIAMSTSYLYIGTTNSLSLTVVNIRNQTSLATSSLSIGFGPNNGIVIGRYLFTTSSPSGRVNAFDIISPATPVALGQSAVLSPGAGGSLAVSGRYIYSNNSTVLSVLDMGGADLASARIASLEAGTIQTDIDLFAGNNISAGNTLFVGAGGIISNGGLSITSTSSSVISGALGIGTSTNIYGGALTGGLTLNNAIVLASSTALSTSTSALYNNNGTLYWNGSAIGGSISNWTTSGTSSIYVSNNQIKVGIGTTTNASSTNTLTLAGTFWNGIGTSTNISVVGTTSPASSPTFNDLDVQGQFAYTVDGGSLRIFNIASSTKPVQVGSVSLPNNAHKISLSGDIAYVTNYNGNALSAYNVSNPASPYLVSSLPVQTSAIKSRGRYVYLTSYTGSTLNVADYASTTAPVVISTAAVGANPYGVALGDNYAYVVGFGSNNLSVVNISNPYSIQTVGTVSGGGIMSDPSYSNGYVYAAQGTNIVVFDVTTPSSPVLVKTISAGGAPQGVEAKGRYLYVGSDSTAGSLKVYDISNPILMSEVANALTPNLALKGIRVVGKYAYVVGNGSKSINILDVGGAEFGSLSAGAITSGSLHVISDITAGGNISAEAGIFGAQGITSFGGIAVVGSSSRSVFNGQVSIGTTTSTSTTDRLRVAGDIQIGTTGSGCLRSATGAIISGTCSSDLNLKTNIQDIDTLLDKFANIKFVTYNWNQLANEKLGNDISATNTGLIAQQVETQFPELISTSSLGYKQVDFTTLQFYAYKAIQELNNKIFGNSTSTNVLTIEEITASTTISLDAKLKALGTNADEVNKILKDLASSTVATSTATTTEIVTISTSTSIIYVNASGTPCTFNISDCNIATSTIVYNYATTTVSTTTPTFVGLFLNKMITWLADATNGIQKIFVGEIHAKDKICIGETCLTENELKNLLNQNNSSIVPPTENSAETPIENPPTNTDPIIETPIETTAETPTENPAASTENPQP